jgi:AcrR family transcriptional regulator
VKTENVAARALATRATLVELAGDLFAEQGYLQTSMRDVARRASVTTGAIYGHFRNKADLLVEAISERVRGELEDPATALNETPDHVETLTRLASDFRRRRRLRALIVQGAAAAQTDAETRDRLRADQLAHLTSWIKGYETNRERLGIDPSVDLQAAVLYTWAAEVGLGVLEAIGIEPKSAKGWAEVHNRLARSLRLPPER